MGPKEWQGLGLGRNRQSAIASILTDEISIEAKLEREWLLTNSRGSFASGTIAGCNTRRYHGLLVGSTTPPANRIMALSTCLETLLIDGQEFSLSTFEFNDRIAPEGCDHLVRFRRDLGASFEFELGPIHITKSIYLSPDSDTVAIEYDLSSVGDGFTFMLRPMTAMRNFHHLQNSKSPLYATPMHNGVSVRSDLIDNTQLLLRCDNLHFENDSQWWYGFNYRVERERGQDFSEDLWTPGQFKAHIEEPCKIVLWGHFGDSGYQFAPALEIESLLERLRAKQTEATVVPHGSDKTFHKLCLAADQFVIERKIRGKDAATIIAGYPWFMDWGRDTFISLPGLLLSTEKFDQAASVLTTFASAAEDGIIPNRFDDFTDMPHYNNIDASLWFINAAFKYLEESGDENLFAEKLIPAIRWIVDSYYYGTKFGIHADSDGLITGGNQETQLTWMDAKTNGIVFTPRHGKAVEINALWYNALMMLAEYYSNEDRDFHNHYKQMADEVSVSFKAAFWNPTERCLYDCIMPHGTADTSIRPNQIFAVSLQYSPLSPDQARHVVETVRKYLLTPLGLRTLNREDVRYHGQCRGNQLHRDEAYHQGTVWPWLMGSFIEAHLKVNKFSRKSKREAIEYIRPLLAHLTEDGCIGSVAEIFDGETPHKPGGCFAQAWSVAELMRAYLLIID